MTEIILRQPGALVAISPVATKALEALPPVEQKIIKAGLAPALATVPGEDAETQIITFITTAITIAGQKADEATVFIYAGELYEKLLEDFPKITTEEIKAALRAGVYGAYGEYYGLNPKTFYHFVKSYLHSEARNAARELYEQKIDAVHLLPAPIDEEENRDRNIAFVEACYNEYLTGNMKVDFVPGYVYDLLTSEGLLVLSELQKKTLKETARNYLKNADKQKQKEFGTLKALLPGMLMTRLKFTCRRLAVLSYFAKCKAENKKQIFNETGTGTDSR